MLISIREAASKGIERVRMPKWANELDHVKIDIINNLPGPWTHLYSPINKQINGRDPVDVLCMYLDYDAHVYEPYTGCLPDSEEYVSCQTLFESMTNP
jgi:hypothetical protein